MMAWVRWGVLWRSRNTLDGKREHLVGHMGMPALFRTRREARAYIANSYAYIADRPDLRKEPHGWQTPVAVRVAITPMAK
jgi:hypothetical protein